MAGVVRSTAKFNENSSTPPGYAFWRRGASPTAIKIAGEYDMKGERWSWPSARTAQFHSRIWCVLLASLALSGCASTASQILEPIVKQGVPYWESTGAEDGDKQVVEWRSNVPADPGGREIVTEDVRALPVALQGQAGSWSWFIHANGQASELIRNLSQVKWSQFDVEGFEFRALLEKMESWTKEVVDNEMQNRTFHIYLVERPNGVDSRIEVDIGRSASSIHIAVPVVTDFPDKSSAIVKLYSDLTRLAAVVGATAFSSYDTNVGSAYPEAIDPEVALNRKMKELCWLSVGRRFLYSGTSFSIRPPASTSELTQSVLSEMYSNNPSDPRVRAAYALTLFQENLNSWMRKVKAEWPQTGQDESSLMEMKRYCTNFIRDK